MGGLQGLLLGRLRPVRDELGSMDMWSSIVTALLGKVAPKVADYYIKKQELEAEIELEKARGQLAWEQALTKRASESEGRDHEWEMLRIKNAGWKDEFVLLIISPPLVMSFIPQTQEHVLRGFQVLEQTPIWYQSMVLVIFFAIYGIRKWRRKQAMDIVR